MKKLRLQLLSVFSYTFMVVVLFSSSSKAENYFGCYAVKYGATWCGPCKILETYIDGSEVCSSVTPVVMNTLPEQYCQEMIDNLGLTTYPTVKIYRYEYNSTSGAGSERIIATITGLGTGQGNQNSTVLEVARILNGPDCVQRSVQVSVAPTVSPTPFIANISDFNPNPTVSTSPSSTNTASFTSNSIR